MTKCLGFNQDEESFIMEDTETGYRYLSPAVEAEYDPNANLDDWDADDYHWEEGQ